MVEVLLGRMVDYLPHSSLCCGSLLDFSVPYLNLTSFPCSLQRILSIPSSDGVRDTFNFLIFRVLRMQVMILCDLSM